MAPLANPYGNIDAWSRVPLRNQAIGASTIRDEGYPSLTPPELTGPATPLPPQRPVRRPPTLNIAAAKAELQEILDKATSQPNSPGTPHWGSSPAPESRSLRWCATPVTDIEDDMGDVISDSDNSSVMSFDGGSAVGSPALKDVLDTFLTPHSDNSDSSCAKIYHEENQDVSKEAGAEIARSSAPKPMPAPEEDSCAVLHEQPANAAMQHSADADRIESIRKALKRVAVSLGPDGAKDLLTLREERLLNCETFEEHTKKLARVSSSEAVEMVSFVQQSQIEADALRQTEALPESCLDECDSLPTEVPSDAASDPTNSPTNSHTSADEAQGQESLSTDSDHATSGAVARAVAKVASSRFGIAITDEMAHAAAALPTPSATSNLQPSLRAASCMPLPLQDCRRQAGSQPSTRMPLLAAPVPRTPTSGVELNLQSKKPSIRTCSELPLQDIVGTESDMSASHQQRCTHILSRLDHLLEEVDHASASWLSGPPPQQQGDWRAISAPQTSSRNCALNCPRGHTLVPTSFRRDWICDGCERRFTDVTDGECCHRCAVCDFDLCGPCATSAANQKKPISIQASPQSPLDLHDRVALPLMKRTEDLGKAYRCLEEVNWLNICMHGVVMPAAVYNQACCLVLGAQAVLQGSGELIEPQLPPYSMESTKSRDVVEHRLDLGMEMLSRAAQAGYSDVTNMLRDPDLKLLRERRSIEFNGVLQQVHHLVCKPALTV